MGIFDKIKEAYRTTCRAVIGNLTKGQEKEYREFSGYKGKIQGKAPVLEQTAIELELQRRVSASEGNSKRLEIVNQEIKNYRSGAVDYWAKRNQVWENERLSIVSEQFKRAAINYIELKFEDESKENQKARYKAFIQNCENKYGKIKSEDIAKLQYQLIEKAEKIRSEKETIKPKIEKIVTHVERSYHPLGEVQRRYIYQDLSEKAECRIYEVSRNGRLENRISEYNKAVNTEKKVPSRDYIREKLVA